MNALNKSCEVIKHQVHPHLAFVFTVLQCSASLWEAPGHMPSEVLLKDLGPFCFICLCLLVYCLDPFYSWENFFFRRVYSVLLRVEEENKSERPLSSSSSSYLSTADRLGVAAYILRYQMQSPSSDCFCRVHGPLMKHAIETEISLLNQFGRFDSHFSTKLN